jgi:glycosyltransferase involved in cell wall biosynthesis
MLLSITIPAFNRPEALRRALDVFVAQIEGKHESEVEIIVVDDASPSNSLGFVSDYADSYAFIKYRRLGKNIGLERNLVNCVQGAVGEFLWIFGDDDFLEADDALDDIVARLKRGETDMLVLNRTRRSRDLSVLISDDWMGLHGRDRRYLGLREFCFEFGYLSVIGFISVNIMRRKPFLCSGFPHYLGTMYPQLGAMLEAFHSRPVELVGRPLVCHRTQTADEKRAELGAKPSESDFMVDYSRRNALYFSHPHIAMMNRLLDAGAFRPDDVVQIVENTVTDGLLIDFFIDCIAGSLRYPDRFTDVDWQRTQSFFARLPLTTSQIARVEEILALRQAWVDEECGRAGGHRPVRTISVLTPSYSQGEFLPDCLESVESQTFKPIEHLVFDPGSTDGSRTIAMESPGVTLFAEPDSGQSDALNNGFDRSRGDVIAWLNSDDMFADASVFQKVVDRFNQPDCPDIVYGNGIFIDEHGHKLRDAYVNIYPETLPWKLQEECGILQPALFMRRSVIDRVGKLSASLHFSMDYEYWIRCTKAGVRFAFVDDVFAIARYHNQNKTYGQRGKSYAEVALMLTRHFGYVHNKWLRRYAEFLCDGHDGVLSHAAKDGVRDPTALERDYDRLLLEHDCGVLAYCVLCSRASEKGYQETLVELKDRGLDPIRAGLDIGTRTQSMDVQWVETSSLEVLPTISLVTPSLNTARYLGDTLQSVVSQKYPKLQYVVVDGDSSDGSQDIIDRYRDRLHAYVSEKDGGHADALNKGFSLTDGEIMGWINSDDVLLPGALASVARLFAENPQIDWITGRPSTVEEDNGGFRLHGLRKFSRFRFMAGHYRWIQQESTFWRRSLWECSGARLDESIRYACDMDLWVRFFRHAELYSVDLPLGAFRRRAGQRSIAFKESYELEAERIIEREAGQLDPEYAALFGPILGRVKSSRDALPEVLRESLLAIADTPTVSAHALIENNRGLLKDLVMKERRVSGRKWSSEILAPDDVRGFRDRHAGQRCFIMGNGPSLNRMDLSKLEGEIVFGCNGVFLLYDRISWRPTYYTCVDSRVLPDRAVEIDQMLRSHPDMVAFFPTEIREHTGDRRKFAVRALIPPERGRYFLTEKPQSMDDLPFSMFSMSANEGLVQPFTVAVTMLQLAFYMGFDEVYLIGCDTSYVIPKDVEKEGLTAKGELGLGLTSKEDNDPNHFDPRYFGKGRKWHDPQTDRMIEHYGYAKQVFEKAGRRVFNATVGGNLEVFERVDFDSVFVAKERASQGVGSLVAATRQAIPTGTDGSGDAVEATSRDRSWTAAGRTQNVKRRFYAPFGEWVMRKSPESYRFLHRLRLGVSAIWRRRRWTGPVLVMVLLAFGLGWIEPFSQYRESIWGIAAFGVLVVATAYVAMVLRRVALTLSADVESLRGRLASLDRGLSSRLDQLAAGQKRLDETLARRDAVLATLENSAAKAKENQRSLEDQLASSRAMFENGTAQQEERLAKVSGRADGLEARLDSLERLASALIETNEALNGRTGQLEEAIDRAGLSELPGDVSRLNRAFEAEFGFLRFGRVLTSEHLETLLTKWSKLLNLELSRASLDYLAKRIREVEANLSGRLAAPIEDAVLRTLVAASVQRKDLDFLEIGVLFGIGSAAIYDFVRGRFESVHITAIDPLYGYYGASNLDALLKIPVNEQTFWRNMRSAGIPNEDVTLIDAFSYEDRAIAEAAEREYDLLILDGDHSYAGVKADFENYAKFVRRGGYVLFDDYGSNDWPEVKKYVDEEILGRGDVVLVGSEWRTAVFRVVSKTAG